MLYYFWSNVILLSSEGYITFRRMLYYFRSELQVLRLGSNITTQAKYLKFGWEALLVPRGSAFRSLAFSLLRLPTRHAEGDLIAHK